MASEPYWSPLAVFIANFVEIRLKESTLCSLVLCSPDLIQGFFKTLVNKAALARVDKVDLEIRLLIGDYIVDVATNRSLPGADL